MNTKPRDILIEYRFKTEVGMKPKMRLRIAQVGRGNISFTHPKISPEVAKILKPFIAVLKNDYSKLASLYQKEIFVSGLIMREILIDEDDESPFSVISIARHTGAYSGLGSLQPADWVSLVVPEGIDAKDVLINVKLVLRLLRTFLINYSE